MNTRPSLLRKIFSDSGTLRPGWGCLLFIIIAIATTYACELPAQALLRKLRSGQDERHAAELLLDRSLQLLAILIATWIMSRIEKRKLREYGFAPFGFGNLYVRGFVIGFAGLSLLLLGLRLWGVWYLDSLDLHGYAVWWHGISWLVAFAVVGAAEESQLRGYLLSTLTRGVGFWPAAIILSVLFGLLHLGNGDENVAGILFAVFAGIAFSVMIRRTGSLALVFALHSAWDWAQSFFYGTLDSGQHIYGRLFRSHYTGNVLISGGSAGPEGSLFALPILLAMVAAVRIACKPSGSKSEGAQSAARVTGSR